MHPTIWRIARILIVLLIVVAVSALQEWREKDAPAPPPEKPPAAADQSPEPRPPATPEAADTTVEDVTIRDQSERVVFEGDVDLRETLARIDAGKKLKFRNDGTVFQNRERRLPAQASGYYREWVHPTPGLSGPGPQRVVTGAKGEAFYTPDHYQTFEQIR